MRPSEDFESSASNSRGALAATHLRAVSRNAASCGVSSKFIGASPVSPRSPDRRMGRAQRNPSLASPRGLMGLASLYPSYGSSPSSLGRYLVERHVLVDPDIAGQAKHALGDDVAHDLIGAAFNAGTGRAHQHRLEFAGELGALAAQHAGRTFQVHRIHRDVLDHRAGDELADGILRS